MGSFGVEKYGKPLAHAGRERQGIGCGGAILLRGWRDDPVFSVDRRHPDTIEAERPLQQRLRLVSQ